MRKRAPRRTFASVEERKKAHNEASCKAERKKHLIERLDSIRRRHQMIARRAVEFGRLDLLDDYEKGLL